MNSLFLAPTTLLNATPMVLIDAADHAGYDGVGLRLERSPNLPYYPVVGNPGLIRDMKRALNDTDLQVLDIMAFYLQPDFNLPAVLPALELSAEFGALYVLVQGDDADWSRLCDHFGQFCEAAATLQLGAAIEFVPSRPVSTLALALKLLKDVPEANASIVVDPLHLIRSGGQAADLAAVDPALFPYAQISDGLLGPGEPDLRLLGRMPLGQRSLPGEGVLPLRQIIAALPEGIPLSVEILQPHEGAYGALSARAWSRLALDVTRKFLQ